MEVLAICGLLRAVAIEKSVQLLLRFNEHANAHEIVFLLLSSEGFSYFVEKMQFVISFTLRGFKALSVFYPFSHFNYSHLITLKCGFFHIWISLHKLDKPLISR